MGLTEEKVSDLRRQAAARVLDAVSRVTGVPVETMCSRGGGGRTADARHIAMFLLRNGAGLTLQATAEAVGRRCHSSTLRGIEKVERIAGYDPVFGVLLLRCVSESAVAETRALMDLIEGLADGPAGGGA